MQSSQQVRVTSYNACWASMYESEVARLWPVISAIGSEIHHVGSTAIRGAAAKPIIDLLLLVDDLAELDALNEQMRAAGYEVMGEFGIPQRRYFRRDSEEGVRTHQIHAFCRGSFGAARHLAFRDYMNAHPRAVADYSSLKLDLAARFPADIQSYMDGKDAFVKEHEALALVWASA